MISRASFFFIPSALFIVLLATPLLVLAQSLTYQPLVGIPGINNTATDFNLYINQLYFLSISLAALLAVIKIIIGGVKWMLSDGPSGKSGAKDDIRSALLGLLLIVSAVLILGTINPQLRDLNVLGGAPALNPLPSAGQRQSGSGTIGNNSAVVTPAQGGGSQVAPAQGFTTLSQQAQRAQEAECNRLNQSNRIYTYRVINESGEGYSTRTDTWSVGRFMPTAGLIGISCS